MSWKRPCCRVGFLIGLALGVYSVAGHPVSLTTATLQVGADSITVSLEVLWEDLVLFHGLEPDSAARFDSNEIREAAVSHEAFVQERLILLDGNGTSLPVSLENTEPNVPNDEWIPQEDLMRHRVNYELRFTGNQLMDLLTVVQRFGTGDVAVPAVMDLSVRRGDRWLHPPTQLMSEQPLTIAIGDEPVPQGEESQWEAIQRQKQADAVSRLGLASYSALYSFIYVDEETVRHEVLVPLQTLDQWLPVARADPNRVTVAEQEQAVESIWEFFQQRTAIRLNGKRVPSQEARVRFIGVDVRDLASLSPAKDLSAYQTRVGIQLRYPVDETLREVEIPWSIYGVNAAAVQSTVFIQGEAPSRFRFWKGGNAWRWRREGEALVAPPAVEIPVPPIETIEVPVRVLAIVALTLGMSLLLWRRPSPRVAFVGYVSVAGLAAVLILWSMGSLSWRRLPAASSFRPSVDGRAVGEALIRIVYSSFNESRSEPAYDRLAVAVSGNLLESLYLQLRENLIFQEQGGAVPRVEQVEWLAYQASPLKWGDQGRLEYSFRGEWAVSGCVEHWGHLHQRQHHYRATVVLSEQGGHWKITDLEVLEQSQGPTRTSLRRVGEPVE